MDLIGDWWTPLVLREAFAGIQRFDDFQLSLGLARNTLTARLQRLVDAGLLEREPYQHNPVRYDYVLTEQGRDFYPVMAAIMAWGDRWLADESGPPVLTRHDTCGHPTHAVVVCERCGKPLTSDTVTRELGPGFPEHLRGRADVEARFPSSLA